MNQLLLKRHKNWQRKNAGLCARRAKRTKLHLKQANLSQCGVIRLSRRRPMVDGCGFAEKMKKLTQMGNRR